MGRYQEIFTLKSMLEEAGIPFAFLDGFLGGFRLRYPSDTQCVCSVIQHRYSYGNYDDKLEIMGLAKDKEDSVEGWLTAEDVFSRIQKHYDERSKQE